MRKTIVATAVALAFTGVANATNPTTIEKDEVVNIEEASGSDQVAYQGVDITGDGEHSLTITGPWEGAVWAQSRDVKVNKLTSLDIKLDFTKTTENYEVNGLYATAGHTLSISDVDTVSVSTVGDPSKKGQTSPVSIHAFGGTVNLAVKGDININNDSSNAIMVQHTDKTNGMLTMNAGGDIDIATGNATAVMVASLQKNEEDSASLEMTGRNISIHSEKQVGLFLSNTDQDWQGNGKTFVKLDAQQNVAISGGYFGVYSANGAMPTASGITAGKTVTVEGGSSAVFVNGGKDQTVSFKSPEVLIESQGNTNPLKENPENSAAIDISEGSSVSFEGINGGTTNVTISSENDKDAIALASNSSISATKATLNIAKGDIAASQGTMNLSDSTVVLGDDVQMDLGTLSGKGNTIVFNSTKAGTVKVGAVANSVAVRATGRANDQFASAAQFLAAMQGEEGKNNGIVQVGTGTAMLGAEAGAVSNAWTVNEKGEIVETENPGLAAFREFNAATFVQWRLENNHLSQRLGDLRADLGKAGAWARVYGGESKITDGVDVKLRTTSVQVGADATVAGNWVVGGAFTYTNMDADITNGSGDSDSYSLAAYATGFFDCGGYVDVVGRVGRLSTDISASTLSSTGGVFDGSYDNTAFGLSAEVGYHWTLSNTFYLEPQAELAYGYVLGDDFTASNGAKVSQADFQSLVGRIGARAGANFADGKGTVFLHASVNHDFLGDVDGTARAGARVESLDNDLGETWVSYGVGAQFNTSANLNFYGMLERADGSDYTDTYRYSVGVRYLF